MLVLRCLIFFILLGGYSDALTPPLKEVVRHTKMRLSSWGSCTFFMPLSSTEEWFPKHWFAEKNGHEIMGDMAKTHAFPLYNSRLEPSRFARLSDVNNRYSSGILDIGSVPPAMNSYYYSLLQKKMEEDLSASPWKKLDSFSQDLWRWRLCKMAHSIQPPPESTPLQSGEKYLLAYSEKEIDCFLSHLNDCLGRGGKKFECYPAVKGVPIEIEYRQGQLQSSKANLSGKEINITGFVKTMSEIPKFINNKDTVWVGGVLYVKPSDLRFLNNAREVRGKELWIDSRTAIESALLSRSNTDPDKILDLKMHCFFDPYSFGSRESLVPTKDVRKLDGESESSLSREDDFCDDTCSSDEDIGNQFLNEKQSVKKDETSPQVKTWKWLEEQDFLVIPEDYRFRCEEKNVKQVVKNISLTTSQFEKDGVWIRCISSLSSSKSLLSLALIKSPPLLRKGKVDNIDFRVLPSGIISTDITINFHDSKGKSEKFSLCGLNHMKSLGIRLGDSIVIQSMGESSKIVRSLGDGTHSKKWEWPSHCPRCGTQTIEMEVEDDKVILCPTHLSCSVNSLDELTNFIGSCAFNINSLTPSLIDEMFRKGLMSSFSDIFKLNMNDYKLLEGMNASRFSSILSDIENSKKIHLSKFIYALSIKSITYPMAEDLARSLGGIGNFLSLSGKDIKSTKLLDSEAVTHLMEFVQNSFKMEEVKRLIKSGVEVIEPHEDVMRLCYKRNGKYSKNDYEEIIDKIRSCQKKSFLTDFEFDWLCRTADEVEKKHPEWKMSRNHGEKKSKIPFLDITSRMFKTYSVDQLNSMCSSWSGTIFVQPKVNGVSCSLQYKDGSFFRALTKSTANQSSDITYYVSQLNKIPKKIKHKEDVSVRGEIFIRDEVIRRVNKERLRSGYKPYADALGALVGTLHRKERDPLLFGEVEFVGYDVFTLEGGKIGFFNNHTNITSFMSRNSLSPNLGGPFTEVFTNVEEALHYATAAEARRNDFSTSIDGMVIRLDGGKEDEKILVYKFSLERGKSYVKGVDFTVGKNGMISAVMQINPIRFSNGRQVSRVNITDYTVFPFHQNDTISVQYSGGVVPILSGVDIKKRKEKSSVIELPTACPCCQSELIVKENAARFCSNPSCKRENISLSSLVSWGKRVKLGSDKALKELVASGLVAKRQDFFNLSIEDIKNSDTLSPKEYLFFMKSRESHKKMNVKKILQLIDAGPLKIEFAEKMNSLIPDIKTLQNISAIQLEGIGVGEIKSQKIINCLKNNRDLLDSLDRSGVVIGGEESYYVYSKMRESCLLQSKRVVSQMIKTCEEMRELQNLSESLMKEENDTKMKSFLSEIRSQSLKLIPDMERYIRSIGKTK